VFLGIVLFKGFFDHGFILRQIGLIHFYLK
jgi:hypothetical protein